MISPAAARLIGLLNLDHPWPSQLSDESWSAVVRLADALGVSSLLAHEALARGKSLSPTIKTWCNQRLRVEARHHGFFFIEAERITSALEKRNVASVLLKGTSLARTIYDRPEARSFADLDVLIDKAALDTALEALETVGYRESVPPNLSAVYRRDHFHLILGDRSQPKIELHFALTRPDDPFRLDADDLLDGALQTRDAPFFYCPRAAGQLLHAASSCLRCGFTDIRRLVDVDRMLRTRPQLDWKSINHRARDLGLDRALRLLLELSREWFSTPLGDALDSLESIERERAWLDAMRIELFPLGLGPSEWGPARHLVRFFLLNRKTRVLRNFLLQPHFDRRRAAALGVPGIRRHFLQAKRGVLAFAAAAWLVSLRLSPAHRGTHPKKNAWPPSSELAAEDKGDTQGPTP